MEIRILRGHEVRSAVDLVVTEFYKGMALHYSKEGINSFLSAFKSEILLEKMKAGKLVMLGAFQDRLVGVAIIREYKHLQCLFVDSLYHNQSIGSQLIDKVKNLVNNELTVNAYPGALEFYIKNGFVAVESLQTNEGICFVPMVYHSHNEHRFTCYKEVDEFIKQQKDRVYALDNFKRFMNDLCNPQILLKTIHIGGTNGKGSTTNYIRSVLQKEGYQVATFTSPALVSRLEIMQINGHHISEEEIVQYANRYMTTWLQYQLSLSLIHI